MKKITLLLLLFSICTLASAQKMVLFEKFTNAYCGVCPDASIMIKDIVEENPNAIWISHHKPVTWLDNPLNNDQSIALWDDLNISGVPTGMIDRTINNNSISISRSQWQEKIEARLSESTPFNISITDVSYDLNTRELNFEIKAVANENVTSGAFRITSYIVEDSVIYRQHSYFNDEAGHPLEGLGDILWGYPHLNVVRTILDEDHMGSSGIIPDNPIIGTPYAKSYKYTVPDDYITKNIKIVAMISLHDEVNNYPGEIQNATRIELKDLDISISSTEERFSQSFFKIAPNPTTDYLDLIFDKIPEQLMIIDMQGQLKEELIITELKQRVNLKAYTAGRYSIIALTDDQWKGKSFIVIE